MATPSPSAPKRNPRGVARREQILQEAIHCFGARGFSGTTTRQLAERAGITEAALYRYFPSKEALYAAIIDRKMADPELVAELAPAARRRDDRAVFEGLARAIFRRVEGDPDFLRILLFTALEGHELSQPFFASRVRRLREFLADYIAQRVAEGAFRPLDPRLAARALLGMVFDHLNVRLVFRQQDAYPQAAEQVAAIFVSIFLEGVRQPRQEGAHGGG